MESGGVGRVNDPVQTTRANEAGGVGRPNSCDMTAWRCCIRSKIDQKAGAALGAEHPE